MTGLWLALAAIAVALAFGAYRAATDGRFRGTHAVRGATAPGRAAPTATGRAPSASEGVETPALQPGGRAAPTAGGRAPSASEGVETPAPTTGPTTWTDLADAVGETQLGERATLVQFSSAFCAPCRATRRVLEDVARTTEGVAHLEIDAEHHLDVVRRLGVLRTPTTLVLDAEGREIARATGAPRKDQVVSTLP